MPHLLRILRLMMGSLVALFWSLLSLGQSEASIDKLVASAEAIYAHHPDSALALCDSGLALAEAADDPLHAALFRSCRGLIHTQSGWYDQGLEDLETALQTVRELNNDWEVAQVLNRLGILYRKMGRWDDASAVLFQSLEMYRNTKESEHKQIAVLANLGVVFGQLGDYDRAIELYEEGLAIGQRINDSIRVPIVLFNLGLSYYEMDDIPKARDYFQQSLEYERQLNNQMRMASIHNSLGVLAESEENWDLAIASYHRAVAIFESQDQREDLAYCYTNLGDVAFKQGRYQEAREQYQRVEAIAGELKNNDLLILANRNFADLYHETGQHALAWDYLKKQQEFNAVRHEESTNRQVQELRERFEADQREEDIQLLQKDLEIEQTTAENERLARQQLTWIGVALGLLLLFGAALALFYRNKWRQDKVIAQQKESLIRQEFIEKIRVQEVDTLNQVMEAQKKERRRIASDIHDGLGGLIGTLKLQIGGALHRLESPGEEARVSADLKELEHLATQTGTELRAIAHNLMGGTLEEMGLLKALQDLCKRLQNSGLIEVEWSTFDMDHRMNTDLEMQLYRASQEIINNVLKHAEATELSVQFIGHESGVNLVIEDNGKGFDPNASNLKAGLGLRSLQDRINRFDGEVTIDSAPGRGTTVVIDVPTQPANLSS